MYFHSTLVCMMAYYFDVTILFKHLLVHIDFNIVRQFHKVNMCEHNCIEGVEMSLSDKNESGAQHS